MAETFDDGIICIYDVKNLSEPGEIPRKGLVYFGACSFSEDTLGITRFYEALRAEQQIERVVKIYRDDRISINQIAVMEDDTQYQIRMVQAAKDDDGIDIQKLSLERVSDPYEIAG